MDCLEKSAAELASLKLDVIVAVATLGVQAIRNATTSIPIVMAATGDPVGRGFVASLARPGGHITGTSSAAGAEITTKQLQLILDVVPKACASQCCGLPRRRLFVLTGNMRKSVADLAREPSV